MPWTVILATCVLCVFLLTPVLALLGQFFTQNWLVALGSPVAQDSLLISIRTTAATIFLCIVLATPAAWLLARYNFKGKKLLETALDLPVVLPPVVAGVGLLLAFGRNGLLGKPLELAGLSLAFSPFAVVLAQLFVASPFYLRAAKAGFSSLNPELEQAASIDGASRWDTFRLITLPLAFPFLLEGLILTWARALGEFGATILFAGSLQGKTRTIPLAIYSAMESDLAPALALAGIMVILAFTLLLLARVAASKVPH